MLVFKIFRAEAWDAFEQTGSTSGEPIDIADGFVHLSTSDQAPATAARHFAGEDGLVLVALDGDTLGEALAWEPSRDGALFPHLYRALHLDDVIWAMPLPLKDGGHVFPEDMT